MTKVDPGVTVGRRVLWPPRHCAYLRRSVLRAARARVYRPAMTRRPLRAVAATVIAALALVAGCNAIFGITGGVPLDAGSGGGGAATSTSTGATSTSSIASSSSSATSTAGSSSSGGGGAPPDMILIPKGTFVFHDESTGNDTDSTLTHDFWLDTVEVTVGRFKAWVAAGQKLPCDTGTCSLDPGGPYHATMIWQSTWNPSAQSASYKSACNPATNTQTPIVTFTLGDDKYPVSCVDWYHAVAFCASEGKRLATETEWQYAASGREQQRPYPWGSQAQTDCSLAVWAAPGTMGCGFPKEVGSRPGGASRDGVLDLAGSLWEWAWDYDGHYPAPDAGSIIDYAGPVTPANRSTRGGSWAYDDSAMRTTHRDTTDPGSAFADVGIRCARTAN